MNIWSDIMDMTQQQYIIAISETGSISKAASALGVSQPAISNWLNRIEMELEVPLIVRSHRKTILTPAGQIYLENAKQMVRLQQDTYRTIQQISGYSRKTIRIAGTANGGADIFARLYTRFHQKYPSIRLQFLEADNTRTKQLVLSGEVDYGIGSSMRMHDPELNYIVVRESELVLMIPEGFPGYYNPATIKQGDPFPDLDLRNAADLPFILPNEGMSYYRALMKLMQSLDMKPDVILQSSNVRVIYHMIRSGNGVGVLPARMFSPLDHVAVYSLRPKLINHSTLIYRKDHQICQEEQEILSFFHGLFDTKGTKQ
jgi:DNA-binding transcriptional LysR family regulator